MDLDLLVGYEFGLLDGERQGALDLILGTLLRGALESWHELVAIHSLVDFETANLTSVYRHSHLRSYIRASGYNAVHGDERTNLVSLDLPHLLKGVLGLSMGDGDGELAVQFRRDGYFNLLIWLAALLYKAVDDLLSPHLVQVELPLRHGDLISSQILIVELNGRRRQLLIDNT